MKFVDIYGMNGVVVTPDKDLSGMSDEDIYNYRCRSLADING